VGAGITEIGAIKVKGGEKIAEFETLINPMMPIPEFITNLTGIDEFTIADAPPLEDIFHHFMSFCGDPEENVLVAHNSPFDLSFLKAAAFNLEIDWPDYRVLDTVRMARSVLTQDDLPNVKLGTLAEFFEVEIMPTHRALADVQATVEILHALIDRVGSHGVSSINSLEDFVLTKKKGRSFYS
jgi:DNA polymerase-3 subunit epsilon